jgi:secreted trypsin-like serine protease
LFCVALAVCACGSPTLDADEASTSVCGSAILRGQVAFDSAHDAVGSIGTFTADGQYHMRCSATLITPQLVLTAKHCVLAEGFSGSGEQLSFAVGPDANQPLMTQTLTIEHLAEPATGGVSELGSDVALLRLDQPILDVTPLEVAREPLASEALGSQLTAFGYGTDVGCGYSAASSTLRRQGTEELRARRGNVFDRIFGSHDLYLNVALRSKDRASAELRYQNGWLLEGREAWLEASAEGAQTCFGDSGGPIFSAASGSPAQPSIVGVTSWSYASASEICAYGTVLALLGPDTLAAIDALP